MDLRARRRRRGADDDAVHAAELDRGRRQSRAPSGTWTLPLLGDVSRTALIVGVVVAVLTWAVIIGGIKSIGRAAEKLAPLKVGLYLVGGAHRHRHASPIGCRTSSRWSSREAFATQSAMGFGIFIAMRYGIARGIYANEAGYGTAAVAYGTAKTTNPVAAGPAGGDGSVHRLVRDGDDQRDDRFS